MSEIASLLVAVESESRIAFAKAIGLTVSEETQRAISIREIPHADSEEMILALQSGMNDWIIDESNRSPQFGFSRAHTRDELHFYLSDCKARVFQLELDSQTVGYYLLFVDSTRFPPEIDQFFQELHAAGEFLEVAKAWVHLVMLTRAGRDLGRERGIDLYSALHEAVVDSLSAFQVEKAFAVVREGEIANKAKKSHLQRGWRETGVYKAFGKFDYQLIRLDLCPGGNWQY
jgi:hypothetical protein